MHVLLTGATGYLGSELARAMLLGRDVDRLTVVVRTRAGATGAERMARLVAQWRRFVPVPPAERLARLHVIDHDLDEPVPADMPRDVDVVIHSAASTDLGEALEPSRRSNLVMTQRALALAAGMHDLKRFVHLSTAYVAGTRRGVIRESDPPPPRFHNNYERTKRESEDCVRAFGLPYTILRPSIIVGRSDDGYTPGLKVLYSVWRAWLSGVIPRAPLDRSAWVDLVPVDFVVAATLALMGHPGAVGRTLHLCAGADRQTPISIMMAAVRAFDEKIPPLSPPWVVEVLRRWPVRRFVAPTLLGMLEAMRWHLPYLGIRDRLFDTRDADRLLASAGVRCPPFAAYGETLFKYCRETSWGKRARRRQTASSPGSVAGDADPPSAAVEASCLASI